LSNVRCSIIISGSGSTMAENEQQEDSPTMAPTVADSSIIGEPVDQHQRYGEGGIFLRTGLMAFFILVGVCALCFLWVITSRRQRRSWQSGPMVDHPLDTEEELEARKQFIDKNLPVKKFKNTKNNKGQRDVEEGKTYENKADLQKVSEGDDGCPICLNGYKEEGDEVSWSTNTACAHLFHKDCIHAWLLNHHDCPMCRSLFLPEGDECGEGTVPVVLDNSNVINAATAVSADDHDEGRSHPT
jgi:hypothetical protein